jgi:hypothetical protein
MGWGWGAKISWLAGGKGPAHESYKFLRYGSNLAAAEPGGPHGRYKKAS